MSVTYNSIIIGTFYTTIRQRYFPAYKNTNFNPNDFSDLALYLEKENVDPQKYFDFIFGMCDYQRPLLPKSLINPKLVLEFKQKIR